MYKAKLWIKLGEHIATYNSPVDEEIKKLAHREIVYLCGYLDRMDILHAAVVFLPYGAMVDYCRGRADALKECRYE